MDPSVKASLPIEIIAERTNASAGRSPLQRQALETLTENFELLTTTMEEPDDIADGGRLEGMGSHQVEVTVTKGSSDDVGKNINEGDDQVFETSSRPWHASRSLSPLLTTESLEDYDLPPQLMMCRRDSVTFINIPRSFQRPQMDRCDTAPPGPEYLYANKKSPLRKISAIGGLEGSPRRSGSVDIPYQLPPSRRTSASQFPFQSRLSVDQDYRLSRSHDDLSIRPRGGVRPRPRSPLGIPRHMRRSGAALFQPSSSLDVPKDPIEDEDSFDDERDGSPVCMRRRRRSSTTVLHRQSSGVTLCVPLQHSLNVSPAETEEEEDIDELSTDEPSFPSSAKVFHRRASGATFCSPLSPSSIDLSDRDLSIDRSHSFELPSDASNLDPCAQPSYAPHMCDYDDDDNDGPDLSVISKDSEDNLSHPGGRSLQKKGSIAIPLERCLDRTKLSRLTHEQIDRCLSSLRHISSRFSESYFAVKGAALILPQSECPRTITRGSHGGDIQTHLQSMFYLLRPPDTIKVAVKLESMSLTRNRYMAVVSTVGRQDTEESIILGIDIEADKATIGLVLPIWGDTAIPLDGDGGFKVTSNERLHIFKPVSVQAMWSALQSVIKARDTAHHHSYYPGGLTHTWGQYYEAHVSSEQPAINEWNAMEDIESHRPSDLNQQEYLAQVELEKLIKIKLKEIMLTVDLEEVTSKYLRTRLEEDMGRGLKDMRHFIDEETIVILRQMDSASEIFPFLYLGSEWNASNLEELQQNGVNHILNVTREIDNFFPGLFDYSNIRVYDIETAELLKHWDNTYKFIKKAEQMDSKVLVHCKMGVSRSASSVIAFAMKEYGWSLNEAFEHVKKKRSCARPNKGFWSQLVTYEGILDASKQRNSKLWRSKSVGDISEQEQSERTDHSEDRKLIEELLDYSGFPGESSSRPRSWSPEDSTTQILMKTHNLASDESSDEEGTNYNDMTSIRQGYGNYATPFLASWDDVDDMSSQSMDSLLDTAQDQEPCTKPTYDSRPQPRVVLLSYRAFSGSEGDHGNLSDGTEVLTEESDVEDIVAEECSGRKQRGFYDVNMLLADFLNPDATDPDEELPANYINYFLHPDYKMDILMAQQRKHRRIAQLLKLSQPPDCTEMYTSPLLVGTKKPEGPAVAPQVTKLRADNSWIKEVPPSPQDSVQLTDEEVIESVLVTEDNIVVVQVPVVDYSPPEVKVDTIIKTTETSPDTADTHSIEGDASPPGGTDSDTASGQDIGVLQHYQKEDIPWNPGTVKRHKHDLERRLDSKAGKRNRSPHMSSSSSDSGSSESLQEIQIIQSGGVSSDGEPVVLDLAGAEVGESCTDDLPTDSVFDTQMSPEAAVASDNSTSPPEGGADRPTSIYELEDIAVEPGVVQRTKQEIEKRGSVTSQEIDLEQKTVQRSSSMKEDKLHSKKDRSSERRRTCTPVLRTSASDSDSGETEIITEPEGPECTILQVGQETVELVEGKVQKHRRAIESRNTKSECEVVTSPESGSEVFTPSPDTTKPRSLSLPLETEPEILPQGSVQKQKQELESRLSVKGKSQKGDAPTTSDTAIGKPPSGNIKKEISPLPSRKVCSSTQEKSDKSESPPMGLSIPINAQSGVACGADSKTSPLLEKREDTEKSIEADPKELLAYPTEDIPWSVGTVRQQKEAFEKGSTPSGGDAGRSSSKSPTWPEPSDSIASDASGLIRTSSCKTYRPSVADDAVMSVARSSSLKEGSTHNRTELRVSLSKPTHAPVHVSQKDITISKSNTTQDKTSSKTGSNSQGSTSSKVPPKLEKWSCTKEVLIVEAPKSTVAKGSNTRDSKTPEDNVSCNVELSSENPARSSTLKPMEEKTVRDLVGIFDSGKGNDKKEDPSGSIDPEMEPQPITRSTSMNSRPVTKEKMPLEKKVSLPVSSLRGPETRTPCSSKTSESTDTDTKLGQYLNPEPKQATLSGPGSNRIPISPQREPDPDGVPRKSRRLQGKSHPLTKLTMDAQGSSEKTGRNKNPVYNTM